MEWGMVMTIEDLTDRLEIHDLLTRYANAIDAKDFDRLDEVFTPDAFVDYTSAGGEKGDYPTIKAWLASVLANFPTYQHLLTNSEVTFAPDRATATARTAFYNPMGFANKEGGYTVMHMGGYYNDDLVRSAAGWRIARRIEQEAWRGPLPPQAPDDRQGNHVHGAAGSERSLSG